MSKTIKQIADELGVSKQAVSKCIDNLGLRSTLTKNGNFFVVSNSQEKAIKRAFLSHKTANQNANQSPTELAVVIEVLQTTIDTLQGQLNTKDKQLAAKDEQIRKQQEQIEQLTSALQQQTSALESITAALTAAQALHAADKKALMLMEDRESEHKLSFWERRAAKKAKETLHKARLTALHAICLQIFRHIAQKSLAIHQVCLRNFWAICRKI